MPTEWRRNNVVEMMLKDSLVSEFKNLFRLTTFDEYTKDPLGKIWITLGDYLAVTKDTPFDPLTHSARQRVTERDRFVAEHLIKRELFVTTPGVQV